MSKFSELDMDRQILDALSKAMQEPGTSAEEQVERRLDYIIRELDEFCGMASNRETVDLIEKQRVAVGQIIMRSQLIGSFLMARQPHLKVVSNNG